MDPIALPGLTQILPVYGRSQKQARRGTIRSTHAANHRLQHPH
jgi:hypothetical protein